jgi:hypothetical protein
MSEKIYLRDLCIPDEGNSRNVSCALEFISTFLLLSLGGGL